eukprot:4033289-Heterocapsa_arctica.AAC.1
MSAPCCLLPGERRSWGDRSNQADPSPVGASESSPSNQARLRVTPWTRKPSPRQESPALPSSARPDHCGRSRCAWSYPCGWPPRLARQWART